MINTISSGMRLYDAAGRRLYVNAAERERILNVVEDIEPATASFALTLLYSGCRISEAIELKPHNLQAESGLITFRTLKRRNEHTFREVPVPQSLVERLFEQVEVVTSEEALWRSDGEPINRSTGYRWIKSIMSAAEIEGAHASPKGLRHGYGIHALLSGVPLNMLQKWMGHADIETTSIYANASGREERELAERMWRMHRQR